MEEDKIQSAIIAIGGSGGKILGNIAESDELRDIKLIHVDTDEHDLIDNKNVHSLLLKNDWTDNQGCGGNAVTGENAAGENIDLIKDQIENINSLFVISALGRGTGSGAAVRISRLIKETKLRSLFFVTLPFSFEGKEQQQTANNSLRKLRKSTDIVIPIPNELIFDNCPEDKKALDAFDTANSILAHCIIGMSELIRFRGIIPIDYSSIKQAFKNKDAICSFGIGRANGENKITEAVDDLLKSPMLGYPDFVNNADVVISSLIAGQDLNIGDMKKCLEILNSKLNTSVKTIIGANTFANSNENIKIYMLSVQYQKTSFNDNSSIVKAVKYSSDPKKNRRRKRNEQLSNEQMALPFIDEGLSLGIFAEVNATIHHDQNLDIPTFQRHGISIVLDKK